MKLPFHEFLFVKATAPSIFFWQFGKENEMEYNKADILKKFEK
jgi:hypothetical protein